MTKFEVSTDSTCDLYKNEFEELNIFHCPLTFTLTDKNGKLSEHLDEFENEQQYVDYYNKLRAGVISKTAMMALIPSTEHFMKMAESGVKEALHFTISYGLSPTVDIARKAVEAVQEKYPDFNCLCMECSTTTVGQGMLVRVACDMRDKGCSLQETYNYCESIKHKIQHFIIADSLMYLKRGGRVSGAKAVIGTMLNVKPVLVFTKEGKLEKYKQANGMKNTIKAIVQEFTKYTLNNSYPTVWIGHTDNIEAAKFLEQSLFEQYNIKAEVRMIGPIIGSHLGPNSVAYAFISNEERPM